MFSFLGSVRMGIDFFHRKSKTPDCPDTASLKFVVDHLCGIQLTPSGLRT